MNTSNHLYMILNWRTLSNQPLGCLLQGQIRKLEIFLSKLKQYVANCRVPFHFAYVMLLGNSEIDNYVNPCIHVRIHLFKHDCSCLLLVQLQAHLNSTPSDLLGPTIQSLRGTDHLHSQFLVTQSMPSRYSNAPPSMSRATISLSDVS